VYEHDKQIKHRKGKIHGGPCSLVYVKSACHVRVSRLQDALAAAEQCADRNEVPEVVPQTCVIAAVDRVVVVEEADDERRHGHDAVEKALVPHSGVGVLGASHDAAVEVPVSHKPQEQKASADDSGDDHCDPEAVPELSVHLFPFHNLLEI
jgi:hypothetical protein